MATIGHIRVAANEIERDRDRGYTAIAATFSVDDLEQSVVMRHRCDRRLVIPFGVLVNDDRRIVDRLVSFIDLGCLCEVAVVTDRDPGDEDLD